MSTCPTPVDRRLGRRLRCITLRAACVLAGDEDDLLSELLSRSFSSSPGQTFLVTIFYNSPSIFSFKREYAFFD